jgi:hypothetical protein
MDGLDEFCEQRDPSWIDPDGKFSGEVKTVVGALRGMFHSDPGTRASAPSVSGTDSPKMRSEGAIETLPEEGPSYPDVEDETWLGIEDASCPVV